MRAESFFFYDLETFGINPRLDRVAQFAGLRTDMDFNPIEPPLVLYCKIQEDYLPNPDACLVTGITPQETIAKGCSEYQFIKTINQAFSTPNTCVLGYNNFDFDDEFIRNTLYRNFFDAYHREWANGNSRWDIINLVRLIHDLRPDGIQWIKNNDGKPSFKLEDITTANGIEHENAHDALADVMASISLLKLIRQKQPKAYAYFKNNRRKDKVLSIINANPGGCIVHTSKMLTTKFGCSTLIYPLMRHPKNNNSIICYDLRYDPERLLRASVAEIESKVFSKELAPNERIHLKEVHINRSPIVAPLQVIDDEGFRRLDLNKEHCFKHLNQIKAKEAMVKQKLTQLYLTSKSLYTLDIDPELQLYSGGFISYTDKKISMQVHSARSPKEFEALSPLFQDKRLPDLLWRFMCRNYASNLSPSDKVSWKAFCKHRLLNPLLKEKLDYYAYKDDLERRLQEEVCPDSRCILENLLTYANQLDIVNSI